MLDGDDDDASMELDCSSSSSRRLELHGARYSRLPRTSSADRLNLEEFDAAPLPSAAPSLISRRAWFWAKVLLWGSLASALIAALVVWVFPFLLDQVSLAFFPCLSLLMAVIASWRSILTLWIRLFCASSNIPSYCVVGRVVNHIWFLVRLTVWRLRGLLGLSCALQPDSVYPAGKRHFACIICIKDSLSMTFS